MWSVTEQVSVVVKVIVVTEQVSVVVKVIVVTEQVSVVEGHCSD